MEKLREKIRVAVIFGPGDRMRPVWFDWGNRKYAVKEVAYSWRESLGDAICIRFSVTDGANLFELTYNTAKLLWLLTGVKPGVS